MVFDACENITGEERLENNLPCICLKTEYFLINLFSNTLIQGTAGNECRGKCALFGNSLIQGTLC